MIAFLIVWALILLVLSVYSCFLITYAEDFNRDTREERIRKVPVMWASRIVYLIVFPATLLLSLFIADKEDIKGLLKEFWQVTFKGHRPITGPLANG